MQHIDAIADSVDDATSSLNALSTLTNLTMQLTDAIIAVTEAGTS